MTRLSTEPPVSSGPADAGRMRRASRRRDLDAAVEVLHPRAGTGVTINASEGGLRIAVDCPLRQGELCLLRMTPSDSGERIEQARVVWSKELPDGWIAGLQIIGLH